MIPLKITLQLPITSLPAIVRKRHHALRAFFVLFLGWISGSLMR